MKRAHRKPLTVHIENKNWEPMEDRSGERTRSMFVGGVVGNMFFNFITSRSGGKYDPEAHIRSISIGSAVGFLLSDKVHDIWQSACKWLGEL